MSAFFLSEGPSSLLGEVISQVFVGRLWLSVCSNNGCFCDQRWVNLNYVFIRGGDIVTLLMVKGKHSKKPSLSDKIEESEL